MFYFIATQHIFQHMRFTLLLAIGLLFIGGTATNCRAKYGCEANERVQPRVNRKGELKKGRRAGRNSELFDKKRRKRMGK
jgi:hypothetical protein